MEGKDNAVTGPLLAVVLVALGVIAIVVRAGKFVSDRDFFNAVGILVLIGGIYLIYKGARTDGPRDMIFGGCMLAVMGFVLYVTDGPGFLIFWLAVIVVAELGLKLFFMMPLPVINVNFGSVAAEKTTASWPPPWSWPFWRTTSGTGSCTSSDWSSYPSERCIWHSPVPGPRGRPSGSAEP